MKFNARLPESLLKMATLPSARATNTRPFTWLTTEKKIVRNMNIININNKYQYSSIIYIYMYCYNSWVS